MSICLNVFLPYAEGIVDCSHGLFGMYEMHVQPGKDGEHLRVSYRWTILASSKKEWLCKVKNRLLKVAKDLSNVFLGFRSGLSVVECVGVQFSKFLFKFSNLTRIFDFFEVPYTVALVVKEFFCIFAIGAATDKFGSLLAFLADANDCIDKWATLCNVLNAIEILSEQAIEWVDAFYGISFFISFISIGRDSLACRKAFMKVKSLEKKRAMLLAATNPEQKKKVALAILHELKNNREAIKTRTLISKKALKAKIELVRNKFFDESIAMHIPTDQTDELLKLLISRTKKIGILSALDVVNSTVYAAGFALELFTPLEIAGACVIASSGIASFVLWGGRILFIKKDPFVKE